MQQRWYGNVPGAYRHGNLLLAKHGHSKNGRTAWSLPVRFFNLKSFNTVELLKFTLYFRHKLEYQTTQFDTQVEQVIEEVDNESEASDADYVEEVPESTPVRPKKKPKKVRIKAPKKTKKAKYTISSESSEAVISDDESSPDSDFDW